MKKLLIAMTAAAVGTCAWATGDPEPTTPTVTYLNETFSADWATENNAFWSYTGDAATELTIKNVAAQDQDPNYALSLNTGSKVLTGSFASNKNAVPMTDRPFFSASVKFQDPSDTLPELASGDKFALVVLDNVECVDAEMIQESERATNLWVIAGHSTGKRAYLLCPVKDGSEDLDEVWLGRTHEIIVKAYSSVMADKNQDNAGFLVMVDGNVCPVLASYEITNKMINYKNFEGGNYLGYTAEQIDSSLVKRYTKDKTLLLSAAYSTGLTSVDFQGQGVIDNVALAESTEEDFGDDATVVTFSDYDDDAIASITYGGQDVDGGSYTITGQETVTDGKVNIAVTLKSGYALKVGNDVYEGSYSFDENLATASKAITLGVFEIEARVNDVACPSFDDALKAVNSNGGRLTLTKPVDVTYMEFTAASEVVLDLNGQTITGTHAEFATIVNTGILKIVDSSKEKDGTVAATVVGSVENNATLTIEGGIFAGGVNTVVLEWDEDGENISFGAANTAVSGGTFNGAFIVTPYEGETEGLAASASVTGGKFKNELSSGVIADGYEANLIEGYYVVAKRQIVNYTVEASFDANQVTVTDLTTGTVAKDTVLSFTVAAKPGFEIVDVKAGNTELTAGANGAYTWTVAADVTITITSRAVASIDDEEGTITVDNSGNANITSTNETVTITGTITGDITVQPGVGTVNVTLAEGKTVKIYEGSTNISDAFTVSVDKTAGKVTITLKEDGYVDIEGKRIYVKPEMAAASGDNMDAPLEVGNTVDVGVKTIPGLMYQLIRSGTPNGTFNGVGDAVKGTGAPVKLSDTNKPSGNAFYKVKVSAR